MWVVGCGLWVVGGGWQTTGCTVCAVCALAGLGVGCVDDQGSCVVEGCMWMCLGGGVCGRRGCLSSAWRMECLVFCPGVTRGCSAAVLPLWSATMAPSVESLPTAAGAFINITGLNLGLASQAITVTYRGGSTGLPVRTLTFPPQTSCIVGIPGCVGAGQACRSAEAGVVGWAMGGGGGGYGGRGAWAVGALGGRGPGR